MPAIWNKDSSINVPMNLYNDVVSSLTYLIKAWHKITDVITVNESTMDQVCPPRDRICEPEMIHRILEEIFEETKEGDFERLEEKISSKFSKLRCKLVNSGCYTNRKIYLCPERIWKYQNPESVFKFVLIHELTHAYLDNPDHKWSSGGFPDYYEIIEESLCEATAYYHMYNKSEISKLSDFLKRGPGEYAGYVYWLKYPEYAIPHFLDLWRYNHVPIPYHLPYHRYLIRRYPPRWIIEEWYYLRLKYGFHFLWFIGISDTIPPELVDRAFKEYFYKNNKEPLIEVIALSILDSIV